MSEVPFTSGDNRGPDESLTVDGRRGLLPGGTRNVAAAAGLGLVSKYREQVLQLVEPSDILMWYSSLKVGVRRLDRTCMNLFAQMLKLVDMERDLVLVFVQQLGYDKPEQLASVVASLKDAEGMDEDGLAARSERFLRGYYARKGKRLVVLDDSKEADGGTA